EATPLRRATSVIVISPAICIMSLDLKLTLTCSLKRVKKRPDGRGGDMAHASIRGLRIAITGGTSGLGLALVRRLLDAGADVAFVARGRYGRARVCQVRSD